MKVFDLVEQFSLKILNHVFTKKFVLFRAISTTMLLFTNKQKLLIFCINTEVNKSVSGNRFL